ncbi:MAG TPA: ROK family protein [Bryobacteraceae bacterium]|jgi:glucokinase
MTNSVLCVDIGGTSSKAGILDPAGQLHWIESIPTSPNALSFANRLCELIDRTLANGAAGGHVIAGIGVAVAGFISFERDRLVYNPNLSWLEEFPIKDRLSQRFDFPIELEVDSNAATMAEYRFGSGANSKRFLCITSGTGLGVGMALNGAPLRFAYGCLGDIGHVVVQPDGPLCSCGGHGCAEIMVSAPALAERYKTRAGLEQDLNLRDVIEAAHARDPLALAILEEAGASLGIAIASMANILFPDHIAIAGGLSAAGDFVLDPAERVFRESASILARSNVSFTKATLGTMATLIGAAWPFWEDRKQNGESGTG